MLSVVPPSDHENLTTRQRPCSSPTARAVCALTTPTLERRALLIERVGPSMHALDLPRRRRHATMVDPGPLGVGLLDSVVVSSRRTPCDDVHTRPSSGDGCSIWSRAAAGSQTLLRMSGSATSRSGPSNSFKRTGVSRALSCPGGLVTRGLHGRSGCLPRD